jgi:hypothetical protein
MFAQMSITKCPRCGCPIPEGATQCPKCGMLVSEMLKQQNEETVLMDSTSNEGKDIGPQIINEDIESGTDNKEAKQRRLAKQIRKQMRYKRGGKWILPVILVSLSVAILSIGYVVYYFLSNSQDEEVSITPQQELLNVRDELNNSSFAQMDNIMVPDIGKLPNVFDLLGAVCNAAPADTCTNYMIDAYNQIYNGNNCICDTQNGYLKYDTGYGSYVEFAQFIETVTRYRIFCINRVDSRGTFQRSVLFLFYRYDSYEGTLTKISPPIYGIDNNNLPFIADLPEPFIAALPEYGKDISFVWLDNDLSTVGRSSASRTPYGWQLVD